MNFEKIKKLNELINASENIVIIPHTSPDGDAIGSCLALYNVLKIINKSSHVVSPNKAPDFLNWTPGFDKITYYDTEKERCKKLISNSDLIFTLDFNDLSRIGELKEVLNQSNSKTVMIDHHQNPEEFCEIVKPDAVGIDYNIDPKKILNDIKIPIQGGLDPKILLTDKEKLKKEAIKYLDIFKDHPYIFNLGHGVLPETDPNMFEYLVNTVKDYQ